MMANTDKAPAIEVEGLRKVYRSLVAVDDVSFVMYRGEAFGFLGKRRRQKYRCEDYDRSGGADQRQRAVARPAD